MLEASISNIRIRCELRRLLRPDATETFFGVNHLIGAYSGNVLFWLTMI